MSDGTHDVGLMTVIIDGIAHGFSVNSQRFVLLTICLVPALEGTVNRDRIDADQDIADSEQARHHGAPVFISAAKPLPGLLSQAFGPIRDGKNSRACRTGSLLWRRLTPLTDYDGVPGDVEDREYR